MFRKSNNKLKKIIILIISAILISVAGFYLAKGVNLINTYGLKNILESHNQNAKIIYFVICFLQPIVLPLPEPITIMGGSSVLGPKMGATIGFLGTILGIIAMFFVSKFASQNLLNKLIDGKKLERFNRYVEKSETLIILMLFILPILPDEVICAGSGLAKVSTYKFIFIAAISKLITSISLSYSLELIKFDSKFIIIAIIIAVVVWFCGKNKLAVR